MADFPVMTKYLGQRAARYDETRAHKATTQRDQVTVENYLAKIAPGDSVLDIPAGTGRFIEFCVGHGLVYTGVDISQDMLEVARTKIPSGVTNIDLRVADARALPFANDAFDYAIVVKFIKWLPTLEVLIDVLREIGRVTRKEIFVQIRVLRTSPTPLATRFARLLRKLLGGSTGPDNSHTVGTRAFSEQELANAVSVAGLYIRSIVSDRRLKKRKSKKTRQTNFYVLSKRSD
jgi:ubiquinone/menaquinone biosynthesis C-methylase UbiE